MTRNGILMNELKSPIIKVLGFGGCGSNTVAGLSDLQTPGLKIIAANTDFLNLSRCSSQTKIRLGETVCSGLGTGGNLEQGRLAAQESYKEIIEEVRSASLVILTAGMGGGTGSGAIEIAARITRSLDIPTISFVSLPFSFESELRKTVAFQATIALQEFTDTLITIPNDKLIAQSTGDNNISGAFEKANLPLRKFILGLFDLIDHTGSMHIDLSYVNDALRARNGMFITTGKASGPDRVSLALENALDIPFLDTTQFGNTNQVILKMTGNTSVEEAQSAIACLQEKFPAEPHITPILAACDRDPHLTLSLLVNGIGATPVSYPISWSDKKDGKRFPQSNTPNHAWSGKNQKKQEFQDILEVPAFMRNQKYRMKEITPQNE